MRWRRLLLLTSLGLLAGVALISLSLWHFQERLIYPAPRYGSAELRAMPHGLLALRDAGDPESVLGFYRGPAAGELRRLWLAFGGNGDAALRFDPVLAPAARGGTGILLVEYPGYGARRGEPSPDALLAGTETAELALAARLGVGVGELRRKTAVLGYSLGSAAALQYAARHPVERIVLVAPFTSMLDMANASVGPLAFLLRHRYDNRASLRSIASRPQPPELTVLHGQADSLIPSSMGRELSTLVPGARFELVPGAHHGSVVDLAQPRLIALLAE